MIKHTPNHLRGLLMTEGEWLACTELEFMLEFLHRRASDRKFRLFACACCRAIWPLLEEEASRKAVVVSEAFADGLVERPALKAARIAAGQFTHNTPGRVAAFVAAAREGWSAASGILEYVTSATNSPEEWASPAERQAARARFAHLLRDIMGNRYLPDPIDPAWLLWNGGTVGRLAQAIYDDRAFERLPILADALEEAGCAEADLLAHCRGPGPHVRGCWAVDLLLGKR